MLWRAFNSAAVACQWLGRLEECRWYFEQALAIAARAGNPDRTAFALTAVADILITLGEWDNAEEQLARATALLGEERTATAATVLVHCAGLALSLGRWEEAEQLLGDALAVAKRTGDRQMLEGANISLAELEVLTGRPEEAVHRLAEQAGAEDAMLLVFSPLAWALLDTGAVERSPAVVSEGLRRARAEEQRVFLPDLLRVQGMVLTRQNRLEEAHAALQEAQELARSLPYPYAEGRVLHELGLNERARGG
ncbi:MAG TPA: tetratricopeptide repeat protein [Chloroflexota bacterium]|nr:tetratricopeptide repeat protein [Chloroflexota bacterium]